MNARPNKPITAAALAALGLAFSLAQGPAAHAQSAPLTARSVIDKAEIEDLLARYYWNFGKSGSESFGSFYAPDAEMVLGKNSYKGIAAIEGAYKAVPQDAPQRKSSALNILLSNPLIEVHGDTATAQLVFTETVVDKPGDTPRILTQGREFDHFVKRGGRWLISKREILGPADKPADWGK